MTFTSEEVTSIAEALKASKYLVAFTGAGISTESGLPDFRGPEGVWTLRAKGLKPKFPTKPVEPNAGHFALVELFKLGILKFVISQNVDNLHIRSGIPSKILAELHGNSTKLKCINCDARFSKEEIDWRDEGHGKGYRTDKPKPNQPTCSHCSGRIISSVVNFGDSMPVKEMKEAEDHSQRCDVMLAIGSSLSVQPAAEFPVIARNSGALLIIINMGDTGLDDLADIRVEAKSGEFLPQIVNKIKIG